MVELFISAFITLFVVLDPPGCAPIYAGLTTGASTAQKRSMAVRACLIAGGIMLFLIALDMVFEKRTQRREARAEKIRGTPEIEDVSVFPMAMPMLAGPGAIASVMLLAGAANGIEEALVVLAALLAVLVLTLLALLAAGPLMKLVGAQVEAVITRLLGVLLAALAAQYVIDGIRGSFG